MKKFVLIIFTVFLLNNVSIADGHSIPKEGKISWMTGWQFNMNPAEPQTDGWNIMSGAAVGSTFNVNGKGLLHEGRAMCTSSVVMSDSVNTSLEELRWDYHANTLRRGDLAPEPLHQFKKWFEEALEAKIREPNAMTLSTIGLDGCPTARTVLMKDYTDDGVTFFTNYDSRRFFKTRSKFYFFYTI